MILCFRPGNEPAEFWFCIYLHSSVKWDTIEYNRI